MSLPSKRENPSRSQLRRFAWVTALGLAVLACRRDQFAWALALQAAAGLVFAVGTLWPATVRWLFITLTTITFPIGWVISRLVLALVYFGLITPLALVFRSLGRDALQRRFQPKADTYWQPCSRQQGTDRYFRQF